MRNFVNAAVMGKPVGQLASASIGFGVGAAIGGAIGYLIYPPRTGDINGDGKVNSADVRYLANHIAGTAGYEKVYADPDIDCNGKVDDDDVHYLARHLVGDPDYKQLYPCGSILEDKRTMYIAGGAIVGGIALAVILYLIK